MKRQIIIPANVAFSDLKLGRDPQTGSIELEWSVIERVCAANGIDFALFCDAPEDNLANLLAWWYGAHLDQGGARDPVLDDVLAEMVAEDLLGGGQSHQPGHA